MGEFLPHPAVADLDLLQAGMITESFMEPVMMLDKSFRITAWNRMCEAMSGKAAQAVLGTSFLEVFPNAAAIPGVIAALQHALNGLSCFIAAEEGRYTPGSFDNHFTPLRNLQGHVIGILHVRHDITHRIKAMTELESLNTMLIRKNKELYDQANTLQETCKVIGRNLYEPLNRIYSFLNMLISGEEANLTQNGRQYFKRVRNLVRRSKDLAGDLLTYVALDEETESFTEIDLNQVFRFISNNLQEEISAVKATLVWQALPVVKGNRRLLYQLFLELVRNALKFRRGEPHISISGGHKQIELLSEDRPQFVTYTWVRITDDGIGFDNQHAGDLFRLFYKAPAAKEYPGTGLGLAVCKKIIEKHKGAINATSEPGSGSSFTCCLPAKSMIE